MCTRTRGDGGGGFRVGNILPLVYCNTAVVYYYDYYFIFVSFVDKGKIIAFLSVCVPTGMP